MENASRGKTHAATVDLEREGSLACRERTPPWTLSMSLASRNLPATWTLSRRVLAGGILTLASVAFTALTLLDTSPSATDDHDFARRELPSNVATRACCSHIDGGMLNSIHCDNKTQEGYCLELCKNINSRTPPPCFGAEGLYDPGSAATDINLPGYATCPQMGGPNPDHAHEQFTCNPAYNRERRSHATHVVHTIDFESGSCWAMCIDPTGSRMLGSAWRWGPIVSTDDGCCPDVYSRLADFTEFIQFDHRGNKLEKTYAAKYKAVAR